MAYGKLKVDTLVYDNNGTDQEFLVNSIDPATYVRLDANGNLGVGVANPSERLSVLGSSTSASNLTNPLLLGNIGTHTNSGHKQGEGVSIGFQLKRGSDGATANTAFVKAEAEADLGSSWPTALTFGTQRFGTDPVEHVRIDSEGNMGIGTTTPAAKLEISAFGSGYHPAIELTNTSGDGSSVRSKRGLSLEADYDNNSGNSESQIVFKTDNSQRMVIDSGGLVGIGTSSPGGFLHIKNDTTGNTYGIIENTTSGNAGINLKNADGNWTLIANSALRFIDNVASERMRIDSSGRLLIGTSTSPSGGDSHSQNAPLLIQGRIGSDADSGRINLQRGSAASAASSSIGTISFTDSSNNAFARIEVEADENTGSNDYPGRIKFSTTGDNASSPTERLRIDSSGRLLIGSSVSMHPDADDINIAGPGNIGLTFRCPTTAQGGIYFADGINGHDRQRGMIVYDHGDNSLRFHANVGERMRIDSLGKLGLGTSSAEQLLHVESDTSPTVYIKSDNATTGTYSQLEFGNGGANTSAKSRIKSYRMSSASAATNLAFETTNSSSTTSERLRIDSLGNVGIGTSTIDELLHVKSSDTTVRLKVQSTATNSYPGVRLTNDAKTYDLQIDGATDAFRVFDGSASTERMRIDSSGRMAIGTTSPSVYNTNLAVYSAGGAFAGVLHSNSSGTFPKASAISLGSDAVAYTYTTNGTTVALTGAAHIAAIQSASSGASTDLAFFNTVAGTVRERMRINSFGRLSTYSEDGTAFIHASSKAAGTSDRLFEGRYGATGVNGGTKSIEIFTNGDVKNTNNVYAAISDVKLKENIVDANSQWDDFKAVRFRKYNFKEETGNETFTQLGVIAQELETVCPGLVTESPDFDEEGNDLGTTTKGVKYSILTNKALVALQEAMTRIETLEQRLAAAGL